MNLRNRVLASLGALALTASAVLPGVAATHQDGAEVTVAVTGITGGTVTVVIDESTADSFEDVTYNFNAPTETEGALEVTVLDNRGTAAGWNVTLQGTDFLRQNHPTLGQDVAIGNLSLVPGGVTRLSNAGTIPNGLSGISPMASTASQLWTASANEGDGEFRATMNGTLVVPAGTLVDSYKSTITAVISFAP